MPDGVTRGSCSDLARRIHRDNHKINYRPKARAWHPPPNGLNHFVTRALAEGRDDAYNSASQNLLAKVAKVGLAFARILFLPFWTAVRIGQNRGHLKVGMLSPLTGAVVMFAYAALQCAGFLIALAAPSIGRHSWQI